MEHPSLLTATEPAATALRGLAGDRQPALRRAEDPVEVGAAEHIALRRCGPAHRLFVGLEEPVLCSGVLSGPGTIPTS